MMRHPGDRDGHVDRGDLVETIILIAGTVIAVMGIVALLMPAIQKASTNEADCAEQQNTFLTSVIPGCTDSEGFDNAGSVTVVTPSPSSSTSASATPASGGGNGTAGGITIIGGGGVDTSAAKTALDNAMTQLSTTGDRWTDSVIYCIANYPPTNSGQAPVNGCYRQSSNGTVYTTTSGTFEVPASSSTEFLAGNTATTFGPLGNPTGAVTTVSASSTSTGAGNPEATGAYAEQTFVNGALFTTTQQVNRDGSVSGTGTPSTWTVSNVLYAGTSPQKITYTGIYDKYVQYSGSSDSLGAPIDDAQAISIAGGKTALIQTFSGAAANQNPHDAPAYYYQIVWTAQYGAHLLVPGAIQNAYISSGGEAGPLGPPTSDWINLGGNVHVQHFANGDIYWNPTLGQAIVVGSDMLSTYNALGGYTGQLGLPVGGESCTTGGGCSQAFTNGTIYYSAFPSATAPTAPNGNNYPPYTTNGSGTYAVLNAPLGAAYAASGYEAGALGYPTSAETASVNGGTWQNFQGGAILWSPATGAQIMPTGSIRDEWLNSGNEHGWMGYPTSGITDIAGGHMQTFQNGTIYWSPNVPGNNGAYTVHGGIRSTFNSTGGATGKLGFPTSEEIVDSDGTLQNFQGGTIYWHSATGATNIVYK